MHLVTEPKFEKPSKTQCSVDNFSPQSAEQDSVFVEYVQSIQTIDLRDLESLHMDLDMNQIFLLDKQSNSVNDLIIKRGIHHVLNSLLTSVQTSSVVQYYVEVLNRRFRVLVDSGAGKNFIDRKVAQSLNLKHSKEDSLKVIVADGKIVNCYGSVVVPVKIEKQILLINRIQCW